MKNVRSRIRALVVAGLLVLALAAVAVGDASAGSNVTIAGTVLNPGWTPPGTASVTLCAISYPCQTTQTSWLGSFRFYGVPSYRSVYLRVETGIATCDSYNYYTGEAGLQNLGLVYCWN